MVKKNMSKICQKYEKWIYFGVLIGVFLLSLAFSVANSWNTYKGIIVGFGIVAVLGFYIILHIRSTMNLVKRGKTSILIKTNGDQKERMRCYIRIDNRLIKKIYGKFKSIEIVFPLGKHNVSFDYMGHKTSVNLEIEDNTVINIGLNSNEITIFTETRKIRTIEEKKKDLKYDQRLNIVFTVIFSLLVLLAVIRGIIMIEAIYN